MIPFLSGPAPTSPPAATQTPQKPPSDPSDFDRHLRSQSPERASEKTTDDQDRQGQDAEDVAALQDDTPDQADRAEDGQPDADPKPDLPSVKDALQLRDDTVARDPTIIGEGDLALIAQPPRTRAPEAGGGPAPRAVPLPVDAPPLPVNNEDAPAPVAKQFPDASPKGAAAAADLVASRANTTAAAETGEVETKLPPTQNPIAAVSKAEGQPPNPKAEVVMQALTKTPDVTPPSGATAPPAALSRNLQTDFAKTDAAQDDPPVANKSSRRAAPPEHAGLWSNPAQPHGAADTARVAAATAAADTPAAPLQVDKADPVARFDPPSAVQDRPTVQPTPATPAATADQARQIAQQLATAAPTTLPGTTEITLQPEELGRVRMTLTVLEGAMTLVIQADRADTNDLMRRHIDQLAQAYRQMGFDTLNFSFTGSPGQNPNAGEAQQAAPHDGVQTAETDEIAVTAPQPGINGSGRLDLRM